ncbi:MAG TPA: hypothetical protein VFQ61_16880, partial [Polyangiaceae bacterium]|nr:hypothetical protein [Polyangiaceae bacterium]
RLAGLTDGFAFFFAGGHLGRVSVTGGAASALANVAGTRVQVLRERLYLEIGGSVYSAPLRGGAFQYITHLPAGGSELFERAGRLYALTRDVLLRFDPAGARPLRLFDTQSGAASSTQVDPIVVASLTQAEANLLVTLGKPGDIRELWKVPKRDGTPARLWQGERIEAAPVVDERFVYLLAGGALERMPWAGGPIEPLVSAEALRAAFRTTSAVAERPEQSEVLLPHRMRLEGEFVYVDDERGYAAVQARKTGGIAGVLPGSSARAAPVDAKELSAEEGGARNAYTAGDTVFFTTPRHEIRSRSLVTGAVRILTVAHHPAALIADDVVLYYLDIGERGSVVAQFARVGCCAIWSVPR